MDAAELYGLPLERFVPERNALARELRAVGRRDEAAAIAALRKPSVAARAVNQLAREHRRQLRDLFTAGDALSDVQSNVLAGRADGRALSVAAERERAAVSGLVDAARKVLAAEGVAVSAGVLERIGETLHAAALDGDARAPVNEGRLERELRHVGLGMGAVGDVAPAKSKPPKPRPADRRRGAGASGGAEARRAPETREQVEAEERAEAEKRAEAEERAEAEKRAEAEERVEAQTQAAAAEADARRRATRATKAVDAADHKRVRAAEALAHAEEALKAARQAAKAAETAHRKAERELRRLA